MNLREWVECSDSKSMKVFSFLHQSKPKRWRWRRVSRKQRFTCSLSQFLVSLKRFLSELLAYGRRLYQLGKEKQKKTFDLSKQTMLDSLSSTTKKLEEDDNNLVIATPATPTIAVLEWKLRVRSFKDVEITVPSNSIVSSLKQQVRAALGEGAQGRYLRLICKGRLLVPDHAPIQEFGLMDGDVVHAVLANSPNNSSENNSSNSNRSSAGRRRHRGTVVGPGGRVTRASNADADDDSSSDEEQGRERMGFDRLRSSGLSRQEITAIRAYFSRHVDRYAQQNTNNHTDEPDLRRRRLLLEDDWVALQGPASEFRQNLNQNTLLRFSTSTGNVRATSLGSDRDFMWGFMLGFFVGFVMLIWVWMPTIPHKQKLGILTGISFQIALNVVQEENQDEFDQQ